MSQLPPLQAYPTCAEVYASAKQFTADQQGLITNFNPGGVADTMLKSLATALGSDASQQPNVTQAGAYEILTQARAAEYISTATGTDLDRKCLDVGVERKQPTAAIGVVQVTLPTTATLAAGVTIYATPADPTQAQVPFTTNVATLCAANTPTNVAVTCSVTGSIGNQPIGALNQIQYAGASVSNSAATDFGTDTETDTALRARGLAAIPNDTECTAAAIENDALSYAGIVSAYFLDLTDVDGVTPCIGRGQLYVSDSTGDIGNPDSPNYPILEQMTSDFGSGLYRAAGCIVGVHGAQQELVTVGLSIYVSQAYLNAGGTEAAITEAIQAAVQTYVNSVAISGTVRLSLIVANAMGIGATDARQGVSFLVDASVTINGTDADFAATLGFQPHITDPTTIVVTILGTV